MRIAGLLFTVIGSFCIASVLVGLFAYWTTAAAMTAKTTSDFIGGCIFVGGCGLVFLYVGLWSLKLDEITRQP